MRLMPKVLLTVFLLVGCHSAMAQSLVADRTALDTLLGSSRVDEGFEGINLNDGTAVGGPGFLTSDSMWGPYGPGLISSGITIESTYTPSIDSSYFIDWYGNNFGGNLTHVISGGKGLKIDFLSPAFAFGLDLKDFPYPGDAQTPILQFLPQTIQRFCILEFLV